MRVRLMFDSISTPQLRAASAEAYRHGVEISVRVEGPEAWKAQTGMIAPKHASLILEAAAGGASGE